MGTETFCCGRHGPVVLRKGGGGLLQRCYTLEYSTLLYLDKYFPKRRRPSDARATSTLPRSIRFVGFENPPTRTRKIPTIVLVIVVVEH